MHGISHRPTDLSLLKEFSKQISFEDLIFEQDCAEAVVHVQGHYNQVKNLIEPKKVLFISQANQLNTNLNIRMVSV